MGKMLDMSAESWLNQQMQWELWPAEQAITDLEVKRLFGVQINAYALSDTSILLID